MKKYIFLILTLCSFLFVSCTNLLDGSDADSVKSSAGAFTTVTGNIVLSGAYPDSLLNLNQQSGRTAFPDAPVLSDLTFTVTAVNINDSTDTVPGEIVEGSSNGSYRISIPVGDTEKNYEIQITASKNACAVLSGKSESFPISQDNPVAVKNVTLKAIQTEGVGTFKLIVSIPSDAGIIQSAKVTYNPDPAHTSSISTNKASNMCTFSQGTINETSISNGLACGSYLMTFEFFSGPLGSDHHVTGDLVYSFKQNVNIFSGLETSKWVKNGAEPYLDDSGLSTVCKITPALIDSFATESFWVSNSGSETASGSFTNPIDKIEHAVAKMTNPDVDYTIYVMGELTGTQKIPASLTTDNANSVTICGYSGLNETGEPRDSLNANIGINPAFDGTTLTVNSTVPVTIKNLLITGGNVNGNGGGIYISNGTVKLSDGAKINGNKAAGGKGGGVYVAYGATLFMYGKALIGDSITSTEVPETPNDCANFASSQGGGIYCEGGAVYLGYKDASTLYPLGTGYGIRRNYSGGGGGAIANNMNDGSVIKIYGAALSYNKANGGGALYFSTQGTYEISGQSKFEGNQASFGGAIYLSASSTIDIKGGTFTANKATSSTESRGGAILITAGTVNITSGTFTGNLVEGSNAKGGAIYVQDGTLKIGGRVSILEEGQAKNNDLCLVSGKKVTITASLSEHDETKQIRITPDSYTPGTQLLEAEAGVTLANEVTKFKVTVQDLGGGVIQNWGIPVEGTLKTIIGTKGKPSAIGDIVFTDGSARPYESGMSLSDEEINAAIAVIFYKGTQLNSSGDTGIRIVGVGLKQASDVMWVSYHEEESSGSKVLELSEDQIQNAPFRVSTYNGGPTLVNGDKNGSNNLQQLGEYLTACGKDNDTATEANYPAFYWAKNYKNADPRVAGTPVEDGWYLPSLSEHAYLYTYGIYESRAEGYPLVQLNTVLELLGGDQIVINGCYWSSSFRDEGIAYYRYLTGYSTSAWNSCTLADLTSQKYKVCAVREF